MEDSNQLLTEHIVISSRIRLARNLMTLPFPIRLREESLARGLCRDVYNIFKDCDVEFYDLSTQSNLDLCYFLDNNYISKELAQNKDIAAFLHFKNDDVILMINEEDHIREQCIKKGFNLFEAYYAVNKYDDALIDNLEIAYDPKLGFLTSCPSNLGTGMRASVMMFLPALTMNGEIKDIITLAAEDGLVVRGALGEGSKAEGYQYQISNDISLGQSEEEIIEKVNAFIIILCEKELNAREILRAKQKDCILNSAMRAYGILSNSFFIEEHEVKTLVCELKLGFVLGLLSLKNEMILDEILIEAKSTNLIKKYNIQNNDDKIKKFRAEIIARKLKNQLC